MSSRLQPAAGIKPAPTLARAHPCSSVALDGKARRRLSSRVAGARFKTALMIAIDAAAVLAVMLMLNRGQWSWLAAVFQVSILAGGGYKPLDRLRPEREFEILFKSLLITLLLGSAIVVLGFPARTLPALAVAMLAAATCRALLRCGFQYLWKHDRGRQRAIVVGGRAALEVQTLLRTQRHFALHLLGYVDRSCATATAGALPCLGSVSDLPMLVRRLRPDVAIVAAGQLDEDVAAELARWVELIMYGKPLPSFWRSRGQHDFLGPRPACAAPRVAALQGASKRLMDLALGSLGCLVTLLLWPLIALAIKLDDGGPVLYRQQYLVAPGKAATYWKFRSMQVDAAAQLERDAALRRAFERNFKLMNDPRITRVGRFLRRYSLDELPEMASVVRGTMSLVGPRTLSPAEAARYGPALEKVLSVKPGVSGLWQVMGRQTTTREERIAMDLFYVNHRSPWMDWWIVARTVWKVIAAEGAY
ncbi:MAG: sugar transferase [Acidobacteriia bacterium]|nr:sugar transferase [Terriglobia bacterium]